MDSFVRRALIHFLLKQLWKCTSVQRRRWGCNMLSSRENVPWWGIPAAIPLVDVILAFTVMLPCFQNWLPKDILEVIKRVCVKALAFSWGQNFLKTLLILVVMFWTQSSLVGEVLGPETVNFRSSKLYFKPCQAVLAVNFLPCTKVCWPA